MAGRMLATRMSVGAFQMNQYIIGCRATKSAAVIDSGADNQELEMIKGWLTDQEFTVTHLLQTHAHIDHVFGLSNAREAFPDAPIYLHPKDRPVYDNAQEYGKQLGMNMAAPLPTDNIVDLEHDEVVRVGELELKVLFTPGHSPGHVCFYNPDEKCMFGGDLIFQGGGVGRTDLPLSDGAVMNESLKFVFGAVPDETVILPGHNNPTTIEMERQYHNL